MSRLLADLLDAPEPAFSLALRKLEQASGRPSADVRLTANIMARTRDAMRQLDLDPSDTTTKELYQALMLRVEQDEKRLRKHLELDDTTSLDKLVPTVVKSLDKLALPRGAWVLKNSVAKRLLQTNPPRHLMKQLGYRSIESLLKREPTAAIMAGALLCEGSGWQERFYQRYRQLKASDCETRNISVLTLDTARWHNFFKRYPTYRRRLIMTVPELGYILVLPLEATVLPGAALALLLSLTYHINHLRSLSAQVKLQQVKPHFGAQALAIWRGQAKPLAKVAGQPLHWGVIHHHFADQPASNYPESFNPHLQPDDLAHTSPEAVLVAIDPAFDFWHKASRCGVSGGGQSVSLQALDAAINYCNGLDFDHCSRTYLKEALGQELILNYIRQPRILEQIVEQLESVPTSSLSPIGVMA